MPESTEVRTYLENRLPFYLEQLRHMVAINSFTANPAGVNALGELTSAVFADLGFTAETVPSTNPSFGNHYVLTRRGKNGRIMGLISHLDTVFPPEEEKRNHFHWREVADRIYGPGTVDIKGGTIVMYMMLDVLHHFYREWFDEFTWVVLLDASEEADADDFGGLCRQLLPAQDTIAALIFEAGNKNKNEFQLVVARKGMAICEVQVEGKASHAGTSHQMGANAIVQLAHTVQQLAAVTNYGRHITVNVGTIGGGTVTNRVPHQATALLEMRAFTPQDYQDALQQILSLNGPGAVQSQTDGYTCKVTVTVQRKTSPWPRNPQTDRLFNLWQEAGTTLGLQVLPEERGGLSDGNHFWHQIPTIDGLGPAGGNAHCSEQSADGSKEQEYCRVSSFVPKALLNVTAVLRLLTET